MLQVTGLTVRAAGGDVLVDDVSFAVAKGSVVAIVGPTGAGKTMLLNALAGRFEIESGSVCLNGEEVSGDDRARRRLGYVPQDDFLHPQLGLRHTLEYAASLRLPRDIGADERTRRINGALAELDLAAQADLPISSLSGGQRKRASVAVELLSQPDVLILDEPTTGLDPGREKSVLSMLRTLADNGRTVLTVTHSPKALAACDRVLFLAPGGRVAFFGPPEVAISYFRNADPADVFLALDRASAESWKKRFRAHPAHTKYVETTAPALRVGRRTVDASSEAPSAIAIAAAIPNGRSQLATLTSRYLRLIRSDRRHVALLTLQGPILGLLLLATLTSHSLTPLPRHAVAALVNQHRIDAVSVALFVALSVTWLGVANAVREIVKEHKTLVREQGTGLSLRAYVGAKAITLGALTMVQAAILTLLACARQGMPHHGAVMGSAYAEIVIAAMLGALAAVSLGLMLSALVTSPDKALTVLPMTLVAQLVFSGAWVPLTAPGLRQLRDLSSAHWTVHAIRSTVSGDTGDWWLSVLALLGLTAAALVTTMALVQRSVLPTRIGEVRARLAAHLRPSVVPVVAAVTLLFLVLGMSEHQGSASDYIRRDKFWALATPRGLNADTAKVAAVAAPPMPAPPVVVVPVPAPEAVAAAEAAKQQLAAQAAQATAAAAAAKKQIAAQQAALVKLQQAAKTAVVIPAAPHVAALPPPEPTTTTTTPPPPPPQPQPGLIGGLLGGLLGFGR